MILFKFSVTILALVGTVASLSTCPSKETVEERMAAVATVQGNVRSVFSRVLNDSAIANSSLTNMEVYERIATSIGVTATPSGFVQFQEAISEIAAATFDACSAPEESRVGPDDIPELTESFIRLTDAGSITEAREVYGQLLCLRDLLSAEDADSRKRQGDPLEELEAFFDSLDGDRVATIFGIGDIFNPSPPTLAFVVDDTGSMSAEISSVQRLIRSFIKTERSDPLAYILTTFNDPDVGVPQIYSASSVAELTTLEAAVNALRASGGGDCPELGMTGIFNALSLANPDSNVIVLTDASPKDVNRTQEVIARATKLRNSIHFFLSRDGCGDFSPYLEVANATFGIVVNRIDDFEAFAEFADTAGRFSFDLVDTDGGSKKKRQTVAPQNCITFSTSLFTQSINILFSSVSSAITITSPSGVAETVTTSGTIATYSNDDPEAGVYSVCSVGTFKHSLSTTTDLDFFVDYIDVDISSTSLPVPGTPVRILVSSSRIDDISADEVFLNLVLIDGVVSSNALTRCDGLLAGVIIVPNAPFRYQLEGYDTDGNRFIRTKDVLIEAESAECEVPTPDTTSTVIPTPTSIVPTSTSRVVASSVYFSSTRAPVSSSRVFTTSLTRVPMTSSTSTSTVVITSSPTPSPTPDCPCLNGGRCVTIRRFGHNRTLCRCRRRFTGSLCQFTR